MRSIVKAMDRLLRSVRFADGRLVWTTNPRHLPAVESFLATSGFWRSHTTWVRQIDGATIEIGANGHIEANERGRRVLREM